MRITIIGGGITGLAAAVAVRDADPGAEIVVLEGSTRLGGKIQTVPFAGHPIETGPETFLLQPEVVALAARVGLGDEIVHPAAVPAALALDGALQNIPRQTLMGIPADTGPADLDGGKPLLGPGEDVAVGALVRARAGDRVVEHLVDPLLGGVYAGRADSLSLATTLPALHRTAQVEHTLAGAVHAAMGAAPRPSGRPVFGTIRGGLSRLVEACAQASGARVDLGAPVRSLGSVDADAVIIAVPAAPAARLLAGAAKEAAWAVGVLDYASVALVTLALPPSVVLPDLSGFLVPADQGYTIKAATFFARKWPHLDADHVLVRASIGRYGDTAALQQTDEALAEVVRADLGAILGLGLPEPVAWRVNRWGGALPQYGVGHLDRVAAARAVLPPTVALAGAAYDGVGIPACVRSGQAAAHAVLAAEKG